MLPIPPIACATEKWFPLTLDLLAVGGHIRGFLSIPIKRDTLPLFSSQGTKTYEF